MSYFKFISQYLVDAYIWGGVPLVSAIVLPVLLGVIGSVISFVRWRDGWQSTTRLLVYQSLCVSLATDTLWFFDLLPDGKGGGLIALLAFVGASFGIALGVDGVRWLHRWALRYERRRWLEAGKLAS